MQNFKRLVAQVHDIKAEDPAQADRMARIIADAVNTALKPLGHSTAWAPMVTDVDCEGGGLDDILNGLYLLDEADGDAAYVPVEETLIPERLIAWRDAAVKAALDAMLPPGIDERIAEITSFLKTVNFGYPGYGKLHDERAELKQIKQRHAEAVKHATGGA